MDLLLRYYNLKRMHLLIGIILANLLIIWLSKSVLINDIVFYNTYSEQLTYDRSLRVFENMQNFSWISYAFAPVVLLIKFSLVSLLIYTGIIFCNIRDKVSPGSVFKVVVASELVFIIAGLFKFFWFWLFAGNYDLNDLGFFYPLSLINFFNPGEVSKLWLYPLQTVNIFHLFYIISIAFGISKVCEVEKADSEKVVLLSYLPGLVIWIAFIMFLTVDISS
jgi:hypothetical protein